MSRANRLVILTIASLLITTLLWLAAKPSSAVITEMPLKSASQLLALLGTVLLSMTLVLSTRLSFLEDWLGGIDKIFQAHHWLGALGFVFLLNHPVLLAIQALPSVQTAARYFVLTENFSYNLGVIGLFLMVLGFCCMIFMTLPYHWWHKTHQILGWGFLFGGAHGFLVGSDVGVSLPLKLWLLLWVSAAACATLYTLIWQKFLAPRKWYKVAELEQRNDILLIKLKPIGSKPLQFKAGQFVQTTFFSAAISQESHPFSIVSGPNQLYLKLAIKLTGDYTKLLPALNPGDLAAVVGPFGRFGQLNDEGEVAVPSALTVGTSRVWVAAGIGATPFLSLLEQEAESANQSEVWFFYCYRNQADAVFTTEIESLLQKTPWVHFVPWQSSLKKRLNVQKIAEQVDLKSLHTFLLCGPTPFMTTLEAQAVAMGISPNKIQYEAFDFMT
jgi:predicted ferric reductase